MYCSNCKKKISANHLFCPECGTKREKQAYSANNTINPQTRKFNYKSIIIIYTIFIFAEILLWDFSFSHAHIMYSFERWNFFIDISSIISFAALALTTFAQTQTKSVKGWFFAMSIVGLSMRVFVIKNALVLFPTAFLALFMAIEIILLFIRLFIKDNTQTLIS